jgi:hypothetical protein
MTSERQKAANRANALHSTGPKTPEGKAVVRLNALRHGLLTRDVVLPGEDADAFEDLWNQVRANFSPVGPIEEFLVERVVNALWRLRRLERAETALFHWRVHEFKADRLTKQVGSYEKTFLDGPSLPGLFSAPENHGQSLACRSEGGARAGKIRAGPGRGSPWTGARRRRQGGGRFRQAYSLREESRAVALSHL